MQENTLKNYSNDRFIYLNTFTCRRLFFHSQKVVAGFYFQEYLSIIKAVTQHLL